jgi:hypothetical protein
MEKIFSRKRNANKNDTVILSYLYMNRNGVCEKTHNNASKEGALYISTLRGNLKLVQPLCKLMEAARKKYE